MQIINTSNGPAILTDDGNVVMPSDFEGVRQVLSESPDTIKALVGALEERIQECDAIVAKVKALNVPTDEQFRALVVGGNSLISVQNIGYAVQSAGKES